MNRLAVGLWVVAFTVVSIRVTWKPAANSVYPIYVAGGARWAAGESLYELVPGYDFYRYSPLIAALFAPAAAVPLAIGDVAWRAVNLIAFLAGLTAWARQRSIDPAKLAVLTFPLAIGCLNNGQVNLLLAGSLAAAAAFASRGRWVAAGLVLAFAVQWKLYPVAFALLMTVAFPRIGVPFGLGLIGGFALPLALQSPAYVIGEYGSWWHHLGGNDRSALPPDAGYQDFPLLLKWVGFSVSPHDGQLISAVAGLSFALWVWLRRRDEPTESAERVLNLGSVWLTLFGPATESATYVLLAPAVASAVLQCVREASGGRQTPWKPKKPQALP